MEIYLKLLVLKYMIPRIFVLHYIQSLTTGHCDVALYKRVLEDIVGGRNGLLGGVLHACQMVTSA